MSERVLGTCELTAECAMPTDGFMEPYAQYETARCKLIFTQHTNEVWIPNHSGTHVENMVYYGGDATAANE
jgi:hypothetical protein